MRVHEELGFEPVDMEDRDLVGLNGGFLSKLLGGKKKKATGDAAPPPPSPMPTSEQQEQKPSGFPWMMVGLIGGGVLALGAGAYFMLKD